MYGIDMFRRAFVAIKTKRVKSTGDMVGVDIIFQRFTDTDHCWTKGTYGYGFISHHGNFIDENLQFRYPIIKENIDNLINNRGFIRQEAIYNDTYHTTKGIYLDN